ncbi:MAG: hypothetical protein ACJAWV_000992 [Flammeovirgaceae bacterium]|jgi:hypothetical protein
MIKILNYFQLRFFLEKVDFILKNQEKSIRYLNKSAKMTFLWRFIQISCHNGLFCMGIITFVERILFQTFFKIL